MQQVGQLLSRQRTAVNLWIDASSGTQSVAKDDFTDKEMTKQTAVKFWIAKTNIENATAERGAI